MQYWPQLKRFFRKNMSVIVASGITLGALLLFFLFGKMKEEDVVPHSTSPSNADPRQLVHALEIGLIRLLNWGVAQSLLATLWFGVWVYAFRDRLRFLFNQSTIQIRSPLMIGISPIIIAKESSIWERIGIVVNIDFRYAGISALGDLFGGRCDAAVVSDVALCKYLTNHIGEQLSVTVLPFAHITDHIRLVSRVVHREGKATQIIGHFNDLKDKKIGYIRDSVHEHFLTTYTQKDSYTLVEMATPMAGLVKLLSEDMDAAVMWEPHYQAMAQFDGLGLVEPGNSNEYQWFMCLVTTPHTLRKVPRLRENMLAAVEAAAADCNENKRVAMRRCLNYLHSEFTGLTETNLEDLISGRTNFGGRNLTDAFRERLGELSHDKRLGFGAGRVMDAFW